MLRIHFAKMSSALRTVVYRGGYRVPQPLIIRTLTKGTERGKGGLIPENFFDEEVEIAKEAQDIDNSLSRGGLYKLTSMKSSAMNSKPNSSKITVGGKRSGGGAPEYVDVEASDASDYDSQNSDGDLAKFSKAREAGSSDVRDMKRFCLRNGVDSSDGGYSSDDYRHDLDQSIHGEIEDMSDNNSDFEKDLIEEGLASKMNEPFRRGSDDRYPDELLHNFIPATESEGHDGLSQGLRACPGKMQRTGRSGALRCHKIDLDEINFIDVLRLKEFLSEDGEIMGKRDTGLCTKCQRKVAKTIKHSRNLGLLPHLGQSKIVDARPAKKINQKYHDATPNGGRRVESKTVL